ncbi:MAG: methionyl-tRNA formyltransferase [Acetobacteraceae bacterium]
MRAVFFGTPAFAVPSLDALCAAQVDVAAVVTQPDRPTGRSHSTLVAPPVKQRAATLGIKVWQPERPRGDEFFAALRALDADIGIVVAYGHLLPPELLAIPRLGCVNVHASLLPRWRGAAPIQWAILSGDPASGVSIMRVERGLDTGAVWHERETAISDRDTAATLTDRLALLGAEALLEALPRIAAGAAPRPQDAVGATLAPKIHREHARIRWHDAAPAVACRIRAMDPAPGAWTTIGGADIKLFGAMIATDAVGAPGAMVAHSDQLLVATGHDGAVLIRDAQPAGRRRMAALDWFRGAGLAANARFE